MSTKLEKAFTVVLGISAIVMTASVTYRSVRATPEAHRGGVAPVYLDKWQKTIPAGRTIGVGDGDVTIVVFTDLQCPFCRSFHSTVDSMLRTRGRDVRMLYVPFPLPMHSHAMAAARATECAAEAGRLHEWLGAVYEKQDSIGVKSWESFAADAGVPAANSIQECAAQAAVGERLSRSLDLGRELGIEGTPSILVNGWLLGGVPSYAQLEKVVDDVSNGRRPSR